MPAQQAAYPADNNSARITHREEAAEQKHGEGEPQVHRANVLVIGRKKPARDARGGSVMMIAHRMLSLNRSSCR